MTRIFYTAFLAIPALLTPLVGAVDFRQLIQFSTTAYPTGDDFCTAWLAACRAYTPSEEGLYFVGSNCRPGDYSGNNLDTEALASCAFEKSVATGVADNLGVEII